ncbi:hypothetical protein PspLS_10553 [Pyricularia sp. CBS 133598]|nr:hypothetical protein PspLS_10553 [Pyricularia sp. CBS 133598]
MSQHAPLEKAASSSSDLSQDAVDSFKPQTPSLDIQRSSNLPNLSQAVDSSNPQTLSIHVQRSPDSSTNPSALETTAKGSANDPKTSESSSKRHTINFSRPIPIMTAPKTTMESYYANDSPPAMKRGSPDTQHIHYPTDRPVSYPYAPRSDRYQTSKRARTEASMTGSASSDYTLTPPADSPLESGYQLGSGPPEQLPSRVGASRLAGYSPHLPPLSATGQQEFFNPFETSFWNPYGVNGKGSMCLMSSLEPQPSARASEKMPANGRIMKQMAPMMSNNRGFTFTPPESAGIPDFPTFPNSSLPSASTKEQASYESHRRAPAKTIHKTPETHGTWEKSPYGVSYGPERREGRLRTPEWYRQQGYYVDEDEDEAPPAKNPNFGGLPRNIDLVAREDRKKKAADPKYNLPRLEEALYQVHLDGLEVEKKQKEAKAANLSCNEAHVKRNAALPKETLYKTNLEEQRKIEWMEKELDAEPLLQKREKKSQKPQAESQAERRRRRKFLNLVEQYERECPYISASRPSTDLSVLGNAPSTSEKINGKVGEVGGNWTIIEAWDDPFVSKGPEGDSNITIITTTAKEQTSQNLQNQQAEDQDVCRDREDTLALYRRQKEAWAKEDRAAAAEAKVDWQPLTTDKAIWEQQKQLEMWNRRKKDGEGSDSVPPTPKSDASSEVKEQKSGSLEVLAQKTRERFANLATKIHDQNRTATDKMMDGAMDMHIGETQLRSDAWRMDHEPKTSPAKKPQPRFILKVGGVKKQKGTKEVPIVLGPETGDVVASREEIAEQKMLLDMHKRRHEESKNKPQTSVQSNKKENNIPKDNDAGWSVIRGRTGYPEEAHSPRSDSPLISVHFRANSDSTESSIASSGDTPQSRSLLVSDLEMKIQTNSPADTASLLADQLKDQTNPNEGWLWTPEKWLAGRGVPEGIQDPISEGFANEWTPIFAPPSDTGAAVQIAKAAWRAQMAGKPKETSDKEKESAEQSEVIQREHRKSQTEFMLSPAACLSDEEYCRIWAEWARLTRIKLSRESNGRRLPEDEGLCEGMLEAFLEMMTRASVGASVSHGEALKEEYHRLNAAAVPTTYEDQVMRDESASTYLHYRVHQLKAEHNPPSRLRLVKKVVERGSLRRLDRNNREYYSTLMGMVQEQQQTVQAHPQANGDTDRTARAASSGVSEQGNYEGSNGTQNKCESPIRNQPAVVIGADAPALGVPANVSPAQARAVEFFRLQMEDQTDKEGWLKMQAGLIAMMQKSEETRKELEESKKRLEKARAHFQEQWGDEGTTGEDVCSEDDGLERMNGRNDTTTTTPTTMNMWWDTNATRQNAQADLRHARAKLFDLLWNRRNRLEREQEASWSNLPSPEVNAKHYRTRRDLRRVRSMLNQLNIARLRLDPPEECPESSDEGTTLTMSAFGSDEDSGGGNGTGNKNLGSA